MTLLESIKIPGTSEFKNGKKNEHSVYLFAISTCQWCKKAKKWLEDNNYCYEFLDIDLLPLQDKRDLKKKIKNTFKPEYLAFPFIVVDGENYLAGFDSKKYKKLLK